MLRRARELEEEYSLDLNRFMWFWVRNLFYIFRSADAEAEGKRAVYDALKPCVRGLRVLTPCPVFPGEEARLLTDYTAALYPDAAEEFRRPRWMHRQVSLSRLPSREETLAASRKTVCPGFRTLPDGANPFLGREEAEAEQEILTVDLWGKRKPGNEDSPSEEKLKTESGDGLSEEKRASLIRGYPRMEELRGFRPEEVPCRVTLFPRDDVSGDLLVTWDARFIHPSAVGWLLEQIGS